VDAPVGSDVTEADAAAIRAAFDRGGELSAAVELRRLFPTITDAAEARLCPDLRRLGGAARAAAPGDAGRTPRTAVDTAGHGVCGGRSR
jgi:hypothetical protein